MMAKNNNKAPNILTLIPVKNARFETKENLVTLLVPRFKTKLGKKLFGWLNKDEFIRVKLDQIGSSTWNLIDGQKTVMQIAEELVVMFGESKMNGHLERTGLFFNTLSANGLVRFRE